MLTYNGPSSRTPFDAFFDQLTTPKSSSDVAAMDEGLRFAIREGGRTVGAGRVTKIVKWHLQRWLIQRKFELS